jgi:retron-type reverse transcriptase
VGLQFARTFTQQALLDAWEEVRDSALADGRIDPELERFEADAARQVSHLAVALAGGEWRPQPAHRVEIAKPSGGSRRLTIPTRVAYWLASQAC